MLMVMRDMDALKRGYMAGSNHLTEADYVVARFLYALGFVNLVRDWLAAKHIVPDGYLAKFENEE